MTIFAETGRYVVLRSRRLEESISWILLQSWHICKRVIPPLLSPPPLSLLPPLHISLTLHKLPPDKKGLSHILLLWSLRFVLDRQSDNRYHFHGICGKLSLKKYSVIDSSWTDTLKSLIYIISFNFESSKQLVNRLKIEVPSVHAMKRCRGK